MTDEEIVEEFRSTGNINLLGELYSSCMHLVYGVCLKYLKDRDESKDAVMQIFEKLITAIPAQKIDNFRSWLYTVTKNHCLMHLRSARSKEERLREWTAVFMENVVDPHPLDEEEEVMEMKLLECIEELRREQKDCIELFYYRNKCYREIAALLQMDEKKVKSSLQNAKRNLKLCIEEKDAAKKGK